MNMFSDAGSTPAASTRKKRQKSTDSCRFFDINFCEIFDMFRWNSICVDTLDMLPYGNEIYIISSFE